MYNIDYVLPEAPAAVLWMSEVVEGGVFTDEAVRYN